MELSVYDILKRPVLTSRSVFLHKKLGQLTFEVHQLANKIMIRQAVEKIWNVKVDKVRVLKIPGKIKIYARREYKTPNRKKAIITLKKGYNIEIPGMMESMGAVASAKESARVAEGS